MRAKSSKQRCPALCLTIFVLEIFAQTIFCLLFLQRFILRHIFLYI